MICIIKLFNYNVEGDVLEYILEKICDSLFKEFTKNIKKQNEKIIIEKKLNNLKDSIFNIFLEKGGDEVYYNELDKVLTDNSFISKLVSRYFEIPQEDFRTDDKLINDILEEIFKQTNISEVYFNDIKNLFTEIIISINTTLNSPQNEDERIIINEIRKSRNKQIESIKILENTVNTSVGKIEEQLQTIPKKMVELLNLNREKERKKEQYIDVDGYIERSILIYSKESGYSFKVEDKFNKLIDIVIKKGSRVVLLGDAGEGKSFELKHLAHKLSKCEGYEIIYKSLNIYTNQSIEDYICLEKYNYASGENVVVILDGFDEIQNKDCKDFIRKIEKFSEDYNDIRIIITSRSNFYKVEKENYSGTIKNFTVLSLHNLNEKQIFKYLKEQNIEEIDFMNKINIENLKDLIKIPFYLVNIVQLYKIKGEMPKKVELMYKLIIQRFNLDVEKFRTTKEIDEEEDKIIHNLEKIAITLECLQKNFLTEGEYKKLIVEDNLRDLLKYSGVWIKNVNGYWKFEHNNFNEYLAARVLNRLDFAEALNFFTYNGENKIKKSWINTVSFLISISDNNEMIRWIIENDHELLIKFERDKVDKTIRNKIFIKIFNYYKEKELWLDYNDIELLANFAEPRFTVNFLINELNQDNHYTTISNALKILGGIKWDNINRDELKGVISNVLLRENTRAYEKAEALRTLSKLKINDKETTQYIVELFRNSDNDEIRSRLYYFLCNGNYLEEYIDIFIKGLCYLDNDGEYLDDHGRLLDERIQLERGLKMVYSRDALEKVIEGIMNIVKDRKMFDMTNTIITIIIRKCINLYNEDKMIFNSVTSLVKSLSDRYEPSKLKAVVEFYKYTNTELKLFKEIYKNRKYKVIVVLIMTKDILNYIISLYKNYRLSDDDAYMFYRCIDNNYEEKSILAELIEKRTQIRIENNEREDKKSEKIRERQEFFELLFDIVKFKEKIRTFYKDVGTNNITKNFFEEFEEKENYKIFNGFINIMIKNEISQMLSVADEVPLSLFEEKDWDGYVFDTLYYLLTTYDDIIVSNEDRNKIEILCNKYLRFVDFKVAFQLRNDGSATISSRAFYLWYFRKKFDFKYSDNVMLDLLSFDWLENNHFVGIDYIVNILPYQEVKRRIISNLREQVIHGDILNNHIRFCIDNNIREVENEIIRIVFDENEFIESRKIAVDYICEVSNEELLINNLFDKISDEIEWYIIDKVKINNISKIEIYLKNKLKSINNTKETINIAQFFINLNESDGLKLIIDHIEDSKENVITGLEDLSLNEVNEISLVPYLIKLLFYTYKYEFLGDKYNSLTNRVSNSLLNIAVQNKKNYMSIIDELEKLVETNKEEYSEVKKINFLIADINKQFYRNKDEAMNLEEALKMINNIINI